MYCSGTRRTRRSEPTDVSVITSELGRTRDGNAGARIAAEIRSKILAGEYAPGARIRQEDVAAMFGSSRVPAREAIRILEADGLVRVVANAGAWVVRLTLAECDEIYQMREALEPLLLRYSAPHLDQQRLDHLADLAAQMEAGVDVEEFLRLDRAFHLGSYEPARTAQLDELIRRLWNTTQPYRRAYTQAVSADDRRIIHDEHHLIVTDLRSGDVEDAERVLAGHIRRTRRHLGQHPDLFDSFS